MSDACGVTRTTIRVRDRDLPLVSQGTGQPVVLLHGVPGNEETLEPVAANLPSKFRGLTLGSNFITGGSGLNRLPGTVQQRDDVIGVIDQLDQGPIHLAACSFSAHAAIAVAVLRPELLRSLLIYEPSSPTFVDDAAHVRRIADDAATMLNPVFEALDAGNTEEAVRRAIDGAADDAGWYDRQSARIRSIHRRCAYQLALLRTQTPVLPIYSRMLRLIRVPTTIAWGTRTRTCYALTSVHAARLIPNARRKPVAGANHHLPEADPERFSLLIHEHLHQATSNAVCGRRVQG